METQWKANGVMDCWPKGVGQTRKSTEFDRELMEIDGWVMVIKTDARMHKKSKGQWNLMKSGQKVSELVGKRVLQGQTSKMNHLNKPWQLEGGAGPLSRALMHENRWECHIRDAQHATSGPGGGRAQHGHSSGAHSTPRDRCQDARADGGSGG